ncbi:prephenate dehydratase [Rothia sp. ZJ932]|uniref:prephenate dehydratase n=1 Tax=Rothia sp. ZJ932 TaxID=2810516 RepID=UPI001967C7EB|nr:prephenate dehydratase [Rothia sp. ZJ932]QRZ61730.1 prephenate dehydratase [Rothia sp. ZJ932]
MRYTFLGPAGTFTEQALLSYTGADVPRVPAVSVPAALEMVANGEVDAAMVPIENSVEGGVTATLDAIAQAQDARIIAEVLVPVSFVLVAGEGVTLTDVTTVSTHTHAWAQVRQWAADTLPQVEYLPGSSTAAAALGLIHNESPGYNAAICSPIVAQQNPELQVLAEDIGDNKQAVTRFVLVARNGQIPEPTGADKTTLVIPLPVDRPGALLDLLEQFSTRGINLSRIESRPTGEFLGSYFFSIDVDGHIYDARVRDALRGLHRVSPGIQFLGSYPRADLRHVETPEFHRDDAFDAARNWVESLFPHGRPEHLRHGI